ncbi:YmfQ family protein [Anaerocolumna sp. MB42-C2]|uniref:YmfQ family protein n=1 Tax=Anaerocolumna sp. MB42-C2 TaxID=3070997 RepID=UPI0027E18D7C|nr:YmfQ family protein [Anaerocolumna sp. MB42-C2]WMJ90618.1 YmfQ family protein [Anaerocolumna sp. MB42-C2]
MQYGNDLYGQAIYGNTPKDESGSQDHFVDLMPYLPDFYQNIKEIKDLQTVLGYEVGGAIYNVQNILEQCFITTATWGLERWEKVFGLQTDKSKSYERRREILMAKLRGSGTTTKEMIKNVAMAFSGGEVNIIEYPADYQFVVQFVGVKGIPQNMSGLINALEEIKPAHLTYRFKYTYTVWNQLKMTWGDNREKSWGELRIYEGE